jgi:MarR-like DNA-binding transcriptional regulator SgrR of sgrS sRNA
MNDISKLAVALLTLTLIFAIKPYYGGEVTIRLNEPTDFSYAPSSYSNLIFYSLMYENFFHLKSSGDIETTIFKDYRYEKQTRTLDLRVKDNIRFSDGSPVTARNVKVSLRLFLDMNLASSRKLRRLIERIQLHKETNRVTIQLLYDDPNIVSLLTTPELVLTGGSSQAFSGCFYPEEWVKSRYIRLRPNPYYPGGRSYLDSIKVVFYDYYYPDVFLSQPGMSTEKFKELDAGIYQNIYLGFPEGKVGDNTRIALYSLLKDFYKNQATHLAELNALTSNEESPITLNIPTFSNRRVRSILRYSNIKLYILSSLSQIEKPFYEFLGKKHLSIETIYLSDNQLVNFLNNNPVNFLLMGKTFNRRMPLEEKVKIVLKEMSFTRFDENYLKLLNQLDEVKYLKKEELLMDLVSRIIEKIIKDGFILPLYQRRFSLYIKDHVKGIELDYYGKPLFRTVRIK